MIKDITIGQYFPGDSFVHGLDPRVKLIFVFFFMISIFFVNSFIILGIIFLSLLLILRISKVPFKVVFKGLKALKFIIIVTFIFNLFFTQGREIFKFYFISISDEGLKTACFMSFRIFLLVLGTGIMTLTTSPIQLTDAIESLIKPLKYIKVPTHELAMMMTIALRFIPTLSEESDKIMKAQLSRGAEFKGKNFLDSAKRLIPLLVPLFINALNRAYELAVAMDARCYNGGEGRSKLNPLAYKMKDILSIVCSIIYFALIISSSYLIDLI